MARTPLSLAPLARHLSRDGHALQHVGYVAALEKLATVCARVRQRLEQLAAEPEPYAVIGHSLGGIILRKAIAEPGVLPRLPARVIMMGTPHQPPRLARRFRKLWPYRIINGEVGQLLADPEFFERLPPFPVPHTTIAGTRGIGRLFGEEPNDGVVAVAETRVSQDDTPVLVDARHTFMMNHPDVRRAIRHSLSTHR
jgi:hypothetical protein